jgi:inosine-uridine nucleoside N-ribohydrolase
VYHTNGDQITVCTQVTHTVLATPTVRKRIGNLQSPFGQTTLDLLEYFASTYKEVFKFEHAPVHDPVAVIHVVRPDLFQSELMRVDIETKSTLSSGQTVCDTWHQSDKPKNVTVVQSVDVKACWDIILDCIERCDASSKLSA